MGTAPHEGGTRYFSNSTYAVCIQGVLDLEWVFMPSLRIAEAADVVGVSGDTVRRWIERGELAVGVDEAGKQVVDGFDLAQCSRTHLREPVRAPGASSARNQIVGLVTAITADTVMAQVEMQCGPFRVVSLLSSEAVRELGLELGSTAVATIKATNVIVESAQ